MREFFAATASDPERTWPYKMDRSKGYEENRLITGHQAREPAHLRERAARLAAARDGDDHRRRSSPWKTASTSRTSATRASTGVRDGKLEQLTEDHSLLNDYIKMKRLTPEEIANFPHKNVIVRALGMKDTVKVDTRLEQPRAGDVYLLCSDGLSGPVSDPDMLDILDDTRDLKTRGLAPHRARQRERRPRQHHRRPGALGLSARARPELVRRDQRTSIGPSDEVGEHDEQRA